MEGFQSFGKILQIGKLSMTITQKIHGTNAQIFIYKDNDGQLQLKAGSRTRWVTPDDDNHGFANFVYQSKEEFIEKLGEGRHFGEWAGKGINSGEGLETKKLFLFDHPRCLTAVLPNNVGSVPVLYTGKVSMETIEEIMQKLKTNGSYLVPGYMKPEGIVIEIEGKLFKKTFENEEVAWASANPKPIINNYIDVGHLLQPIRLEKLLSRDSRYLSDYPRSLANICSDYVKDLEEEEQIQGDEDQIKLIKKSLGKIIFGFVKIIVNTKREYF